MRNTSNTLLAAFGLALVGLGCGQKNAPVAEPPPMTAPPAAEGITASNAEAAADALEREIAADAE